MATMLHRLLPTRRYQFGIGGGALDGVGKGRSFFSRLLSYDTANVFQHIGEFPGSYGE